MALSHSLFLASFFTNSLQIYRYIWSAHKLHILKPNRCLITEPREPRVSVTAASKSRNSLKGRFTSGAVMATSNDLECSKIIALVLLLSALFGVLSYNNNKTGAEISLPRGYSFNYRYQSSQDYFNKCTPGEVNTETQLPFATWYPYGKDSSDPNSHTNHPLYFPVYATVDLDTPNSMITNVIIVQHGNLRNANEYFCSTVQSAVAALSTEELRSTAIVAPQFLLDGDYCWQRVEDAAEDIAFNIIGGMHDDAHRQGDNDLSGVGIDGHLYSPDVVDLEAGKSCGMYVWSSEGWKDGHESVNSVVDDLKIYSYDSLNHLLARFHNSSYFPSVQNITMFGFSAGAQTVLRYSILAKVPSHRDLLVTSSTDNDFVGATTSTTATSMPSVSSSLRVDVPVVHTRFIISDPSTFLYFNRKRPFTNGSVGFGIPDASWLPDAWKVDSSGSPWITSWENNCTTYNNFRYGLDNLEGYYRYHLTEKPLIPIHDIGSYVQEAFAKTDLTYMVGLKDQYNCKIATYDNCEDNELVTGCDAMLQGANRLQRFHYWHGFLYNTYGDKVVHRTVFVPEVGHDPLAMVNTAEARCELFHSCQHTY